MERPTRELFKESGESEDPEEIRARETSFKQEMKERDEIGKQSRELENFLNGDKVNFHALKKIFVEKAARAGIAEKDVNFVGRNMVFSPESAGENRYIQSANAIMLSDVIEGEGHSQIGKDRYIKKAEIERLKSLYGSINLYMMAVLAHEETHAFSKNIGVSKSRYTEPRHEQSGFGVGMHSQYFYEYDEGKKYENVYRDPERSRQRLFNALNEGMVEKLSREVLAEYLDTVHWPEHEISAYKHTMAESNGDPEKNLSYPLEVALVDGVVKGLANKNGITEKVAWEAMIEAVLRGETFNNQEIIELFDETFGPDFLKELSELDIHTHERERTVTFMSKYGLK